MKQSRHSRDNMDQKVFIYLLEFRQHYTIIIQKSRNKLFYLCNSDSIFIVYLNFLYIYIYIYIYIENYV